MVNFFLLINYLFYKFIFCFEKKEKEKKRNQRKL
jgi:hypothetical protein